MTLLLFPLQLHIFPSSLDVLGPLVPLLLGQQVGVAEGGQRSVGLSRGCIPACDYWGGLSLGISLGFLYVQWYVSSR